MTLSRRKTIALIGGGSLLAAGVGSAGFLGTRTPHSARAPWALAGSAYTEPRQRALSFAILAPSPHNRQPWLVDLAEPSVVRVHADPARSLPQTDPFGRQIAIGLGCFVEQMVIAASADGHTVEVELFPEGTAADAPVAVARFAESGEPDPLAAHILARRSMKEPMDMERPVPEPDMTAILSSARFMPAGGTTDPDAVAALRALTWDAWMVEATTPAKHGESVDLMRLGRAEIEARPDGIDLGGPFLESLMLAGQISRDALRDPESRAFSTGAEIYREMLAATPAFVWLAGGGTPADALAAGRAWVRMNIAATGLGLGLHPVSQALQEYPEMAGPYARAHDMIAGAGETVQMLGRLGFGPSVPQTPRWPLETRIVNA